MMNKKKLTIGIVAVLTILGLVLGSAAIAKPLFGENRERSFNNEIFVPDEIIVKFKGDSEPFQIIKVAEGRVREKIKEYSQKRDVEYVEPNYIATTSMVPNDPYYGYQWHLDNSTNGGIQTEEAWDISRGSGVTIAVIDTGIAYEDYGFSYRKAPDLVGTCFVQGYDFVNNDTHPNDDNSHGTHVAGTVALVIFKGNATTPDEIRAALQETAEDKGAVGWDQTYGWGLVDAFAALNWTSGPKPNQPPVANAGPDQTVYDTDGNGMESITLDGSGSYDSDGTIVSYEWLEGAAVLGTASVISYDFTVGTHTVTLTVTDDDGAVASDDVVITVNENQVPVANAGPDQSAYVSQTVNFDGSGSTDDGTIVSYEWDFGDGASSSGANVSHIYAAVGTYNAVLTVTDNGGLTSSATAVITISEAPAAPTAWVNIDLTTQTNWRRWRATAEITVKENDAGGLAVGSATVEGTWSGVYTGNVSGTTNSEGVVSFRTGFIRNSGKVTFTVNRIVKDGQEYVLTGETSDSISGAASSRF